jgi:SNF2 family DNA or RNA helicase
MEETRTKLPSVGGALHVVIINYDKVWRDEAKRSLLGYDPQLVVADESHRLKRPSTNRSWAMRAWGTAPYRSILTGTPTPKSLLDIYGQWVFLNKGRFGTNFGDFKAHYAVMGGYMKKQIKGYKQKNLPELKHKVRLDASILRKDQCLDLPPKIFQRIPVTLEPEAQSMYDELAEEFYLELTSGKVVDAANAAVKLLRLQQLVGGWIGAEGDTEAKRYIEHVSSAKFDAAREFIKDRISTDQPLVVFCRFRPEIEALREFLAGQKVRFMVLSGSTPRKLRPQQIKEFQGSRGCAIFVAQIQSGSLGINLSRSAETLFYSTTYSYEDYGQATDRTHRPGQEADKVTYRQLVATGTVDEDIYASLQAKEDVMAHLMGRPKLLIERIKRPMIRSVLKGGSAA